MSETGGISFEQVAKVATNMISQGINPTVRGVMSVTGGKTDTISTHLRDFNVRRNAEVLRMADELGSSAIAKVLANEVQIVVDKRTAQLQTALDETKALSDEFVELMAEQERDCLHRIEMAEAKATLATNEAETKIAQAKERAEAAESQVEEAHKTVIDTQVKADEAVKANENKCDLLIANAKTEAASLVDAANKRADKAEQEAASLREQVKLLSIDQAKREIEEAQHQKMVEVHNKTIAELAQERTLNTKLQTQQETLKAEISRLSNELTQSEQIETALSKTMADLAQERTLTAKLQTLQERHEAEISRLSKELADSRADSKQLGSLQGQLIEVQRQLAQSQHSLTQSEREREALNIALRKQN